ncbi:MAG: ABC transporter substrate-binding protein [Pseudomonadales bacterium]|nr:ABC transporter substrate-binding protein [Pseudomonadales bacterium]
MRNMLKLRLFFLSASIFFLAFPWSVQASADAVATVEEFHLALADVMLEADTLSFQGRYDRLAPVIDETFDIETICRVILSKNWSSLDADQKALFTQLFFRLSTATYAARFNSGTKRRFSTVNVEELREGRVLVKTEFNAPGLDVVRFDYILHQKQGQWYIISATANGVNDLALKRSEYTAIFNSSGFEGLVSTLESKILELGNTIADNG